MVDVWDYKCPKCGNDNVTMIEMEGGQVHGGDVSWWKCLVCNRRIKVGIVHILDE
jgi:hypothetical protein